MPNRLAAILAALLALTACQSGPKKKIIAVIPKSTAHIFWVTVQAGAQAAGDEYGVEIVWNGPPNETDYARQVQIVDSMVARHVDGMAVAANERKISRPSLEPSKSSQALSGCGISPNTFRSRLQMPAILSREPFGLADSVIFPSRSQYRRTIRCSRWSSSSVESSQT